MLNEKDNAQKLKTMEWDNSGLTVEGFAAVERLLADVQAKGALQDLALDGG